MLLRWPEAEHTPPQHTIRCMHVTLATPVQLLCCAELCATRRCTVCLRQRGPQDLYALCRQGAQLCSYAVGHLSCCDTQTRELPGQPYPTHRGASKCSRLLRHHRLHACCCSGAALVRQHSTRRAEGVRRPGPRPDKQPKHHSKAWAPRANMRPMSSPLHCIRMQRLHCTAATASMHLPLQYQVPAHPTDSSQHPAGRGCMWVMLTATSCHTARERR